MLDEITSLMGSMKLVSYTPRPETSLERFTKQKKTKPVEILTKCMNISCIVFGHYTCTKRNIICKNVSCIVFGQHSCNKIQVPKCIQCTVFSHTHCIEQETKRPYPKLDIWVLKTHKLLPPIGSKKGDRMRLWISDDSKFQAVYLDIVDSVHTVINNLSDICNSYTDKSSVIFCPFINLYKNEYYQIKFYAMPFNFC